MRAESMALNDQLQVAAVAYRRKSMAPRTEPWGTRPPLIALQIATRSQRVNFTQYEFRFHRH